MNGDAARGGARIGGRGNGWLAAPVSKESIVLALVLAALLVVGLAVAPAAADAQQEIAPLEARVWLDRGEEPLLQRGDRVRIYYRTNRDAYLAIVRIDTDGRPRVLFPASPDEPHLVPGGRDFRLLFPRTSHWPVEDDPGVGYFFVVASPWPLDFSRFDWSQWGGGWNVSRVASRVYDDPYLAMDDFVEALVPGWEYDPYALDFSTYYVEQRFEYPRFLCYDCHTRRPFSDWNPYQSSCSTFQIVIYDDPWYSPSYRYRGTTVVWTDAPVRGLPRYVFRDLPTGQRNRPVYVERATPVAGGNRSPVATPRRSTSGIGSGGVRGTATRPTTTAPGTTPRGSGATTSTPRRSAPTVSSPRSRPTEAVPRRSGEGATTGSKVRGSTGGTVRGTPPTRSSGTSGGTVRGTPPTRGSGSTGGTVRGTTPTRSSGTSGGTVRGTTPTRGSGTAGGTVRGSTPTRGSGSSGSTARPTPPTRSTGSAGSTSPPTRGSVGSARPPTRTSGSSGSAGLTRPPTRSSGSAGSTRPPTRGSSGSAGSTRPPTRGSGGGGGSPPPTRRGGGGGGAV